MMITLKTNGFHAGRYSGIVLAKSQDALQHPSSIHPQITYEYPILCFFLPTYPIPTIYHLSHPIPVLAWIITTDIWQITSYEWDLPNPATIIQISDQVRIQLQKPISCGWTATKIISYVESVSITLWSVRTRPLLGAGWIGWGNGA